MCIHLWWIWRFGIILRSGRTFLSFFHYQFRYKNSSSISVEFTIILKIVYHNIWKHFNINIPISNSRTTNFDCQCEIHINICTIIHREFLVSKTQDSFQKGKWENWNTHLSTELRYLEWLWRTYLKRTLDIVLINRTCMKNGAHRFYSVPTQTLFRNSLCFLLFFGF